MTEFPWRPPELAFKIGEKFEPIIESYSCGCAPPHDYNYLVLARWGEIGYAARSRYGLFTEFHEMTLSLEALESWRKRLSEVSISLGKSCMAFDGSDGLIRIYHSHWERIDLEFRNIEPQRWEPLLDFMHDLRRQIVPGETFWPADIDSTL